MTEETKNLKLTANEAKFNYMTGKISRDEAIKLIKPYLQAVNEKSKEMAKKFGLRPKMVSVNGFMR